MLNLLMYSNPISYFFFECYCKFFKQLLIWLLNHIKTLDEHRKEKKPKMSDLLLKTQYAVKKAQM